MSRFGKRLVDDECRDRVSADAACSRRKGSLAQDETEISIYVRINADKDVSRLKWTMMEQVFNPVCDCDTLDTLALIEKILHIHGYSCPVALYPRICTGT
ncbi:hypothetical protein BOTNAR_0052g00240 [Botryotinia narcissicola]|uniref:Uncharacterized protein n=1 Tax=Botryotinia narcissicola TaxID=278944 RepID=A0A4Z1IZU4_9HELO|nr:hypothetical protein BOTNAR_0052g00240 [Botryotinia narcissicola]